MCGESQWLRGCNLAALEGVLTSAPTCSDSDLAYLLRINAGFNYADCVKLLLEKKANPSLSSPSLRVDHHGQRSSTERNALHEASVWGAGSEVVSLLLEYRADVNLKAKHNGKFKTAHAMAVSKGHEHIAQVIAKASCAPHVKADLRQEGSTVTSASSAVGQVHRLQTAEPSHARSSSYLAGPMEKRARVDAVRPAVVQCTGCLRSITDVEANFCSKCGKALGVQAEQVEAQGSIAHLDSISTSYC